MNNLLTRTPIRCPACQVHELEMVGERRVRCARCGITLDGPMLKTLIEILALPVGLGTHACEECGHPQMRRLPNGVFHCPACGAEVLLVQNRDVCQ